MLSVSRIKSASRAAAYYGLDDYYATGEPDAPGLEWGGKGAERLELRGPASPKAFKSVLRGANPDPRGPAISSPEKGKAHHPGWDFTFSAPKSVSVAILVGGDARLDAAHDRAVEKAMDYAERRLSYTRVREAGERRQVLTGNLLYAKTVHGVSRTGDPQRHTHVVLTNATFEKESGVWRALESRHLYKRRMLLGKIYQAELAREAMSLGHHVRRGPSDGVYELDAWSRDQLKVFAKRTEAILQAFAIENPTSAEAREAVKLKHRPRKIELSRDELADRWDQEAAGAGLDVDRVVADAQDREVGEDRTPETHGRVSQVLSKMRAAVARMVGQGAGPDPYGYGRHDKDRDPAAREAVSFGLRICEIRSAVFTRHEVLERALNVARPDIGIDRLEADLKRLERGRQVIAADRELADGVTTVRALDIEAAIIHRLDEGRGRGAPIAPRAVVWRRLAEAQRGGEVVLNPEQHKAAATVLSSADRYVAVQGLAGVGKTTMFSAVQRVAHEAGRELTAITPTHRAAMAMRQEAGVYATTIAAWLSTVDKAMATKSGQRNMQAFWQDRALVVDEASMVSNDQMLAIVAAAERIGIRTVVLMGDERQLGSPEAGAPFRLLLNRDVEQARIETILRQQDPTLRDSVRELAAGNVSRALGMIEAHIHETGPGDDKLLAYAAVEAWKEGIEAGRTPRIIVPTNALRGDVAELVRAERIAAGELAPSGEVRERYEHARLVGPERFSARSYRLGQRLVFHASLPSAGLPRGSEADVVGLDLRNEVLRVSSPLGDCTIDLRAASRNGRTPFDAYWPRKIEVAAGEQLVWEKAEPKRAFLTGAGFTVLATDGGLWTIRHDDGRIETLRSDDPALRFIGYGYAETVDRAQGQTYRSVIAVMSSKHGDAVSAARQYVMQSRPSQDFQMITDDRRRLIMKLAAHDGLNPIALESVEAAFAQSEALKDRASGEPEPHEKTAELGAGASPSKGDGRSL